MSTRKEIVDDEIDLIELGRVIWSKRKFILKVTGVFVALGLVVAFTSKVEYEASAKLLPESQESSIPDFGGLGGLAGLAGVDLSGLGATQGALSPEVYPEIVGSVPFLEKLIFTPIFFERSDTLMSSYDYFKYIDRPSVGKLMMDYTIGLPGKIKKAFGDEKSELPNYGMTRYSLEDWKIIEKFSSRLSVEVESLSGAIKIEVEMPDPVASAKTAELLVNELTARITAYKVEKANLNRQFVEERFEEARNMYEEKQAQVANFADRNRNITNPMIEIEYKRLQNELNIAFEVYQGLASQLEQAKIKVKEETPVFTILEPVRIPEDKSKPKRKLILIGFALAGILISTAYVLVVEKLSKN